MICKILYASLYFLLIITIIRHCQAQSESEMSCETTRKETGTCKILNDCPEIVNLRSRHKTDYNVCSRDPLVVCCPKQDEDIVPINNTQVKRIHEIKCTEYSEAVFVTAQSVSLLRNSATKKMDKCGNKNIPLVVGGTNATVREFPHMALIGYLINGEKQWKCGGMLISDEYVLTAGHCLHSANTGNALFVRLGELDLSQTDEDADTEDFDIIKRIPHPFYNGTFEYYDIALLQLDRKVILNPYKRPACLPTLFDGPESKVIVTGWGSTEWGGIQANKLQKVVLDKFDRETCNDVYTQVPRMNLKLGINKETQFCAGSSTDKKDACSGDSGGPAQVFHQKEYCMYTVIGVTSFGSGCAQPGVPGVFTRIFPYINWIESVVWK